MSGELWLFGCFINTVLEVYFLPYNPMSSMFVVVIQCYITFLQRKMYLGTAHRTQWSKKWVAGGSRESKCKAAIRETKWILFKNMFWTLNINLLLPYFNYLLNKHIFIGHWESSLVTVTGCSQLCLVQQSAYFLFFISAACIFITEYLRSSWLNLRPGTQKMFWWSFNSCNACGRSLKYLWRIACSAEILFCALGWRSIEPMFSAKGIS